MNDISDSIQKVLAQPPKEYSKDEAILLLQHLGVLDANGDVRPEFRHIFKKKADKNGGLTMVFTDMWSVKEGIRHDSKQPVVVLENMTKTPPERMIFSPDDALWIGKELTKMAKTLRKKAK